MKKIKKKGKKKKLKYLQVIDKTKFDSLTANDENISYFSFMAQTVNDEKSFY